jgi:adenylate cyclase
VAVIRSGVIRKLAAILIADVVGFSRHMERDEGGAFERLRDIRARLVDPRIAEYGGRVVKTAGDGMLLEFGSADAALRCAIDLQRAMSAENLPLASEERIEFRIGINLGDIIVDGSDIAGDGVNVAARLEALAEPAASAFRRRCASRCMATGIISRRLAAIIIADVRPAPIAVSDTAVQLR